MANVTFAIPDETKMRMQKHKDIKWSSSIRNLIEQKLDDFEQVERLAKKLDIKESDLEPILKKVNLDIKKHSEALINESNNRC